MGNPKNDLEREVSAMAELLREWFEKRGLKYALAVETEDSTGLFGDGRVMAKAIVNFAEEKVPGAVEEAERIIRAYRGGNNSAAAGFDLSDLSDEQRIMLRAQERLQHQKKNS